MKIQINTIKINDNRRNVNTDAVQSLAKSIQEIGLLNPITITRDYTLVAGMHRIQAFKLLGRTEIPCHVIDLDKLQSEIAEIDENLTRNELSVAERAKYTARKKELYEEMYPETKSGVVQAIGMHKKLGNNVSDKLSPTFSEDTSEKTGRSIRSIERDNKRGKFLNQNPDIDDAIADTPIANSGVELDALTKMVKADPQKEPEQHKEQVKKAKQVIEKVKRGESKTIKDAVNTIKKEKRQSDIEAQRKEIEQGIELTPLRDDYNVIVIDPPWNYGTKYSPTGRRVANPYPEMNQSELLDIELPAGDDCVLFLWTTHRFIWDAKKLLDKWGFTYRSTLVWDKQKIGMGDLFRMQCEFCLVGIKGSPIFDNNHIHRDLISEPRREHSRKPESFYEMIDALCVGYKLDYFSRQQRDGWHTFGNDTDKFEV